MKQLLLTTFMLMCISASAQTEIKGKAVDEDKRGIPGVNVNLKTGSNQKTAITDGEGNFTISNADPGSCQLTLTTTGFDNYESKFKLKENEKIDLGDLFMNRNERSLQSIEVTGVKTKKYSSDYSFSATKNATLNKDIPQSIGTVTKELMDDRQAFQVGEAVKIVSSVAQLGPYNLFSIRGFTPNEEGQIVDGMRTRQFFFIQPLTCNIESVEVIKGTASSTFASVDPGGTINIVTKKPLDVERKEITITAGTGGNDAMRATLDITGPLNKEKTLLYRINAGYQDSRNFRELVPQKLSLFSPSFSYIPNKNTSVNVEFVYNNFDGQLDRGQAIFGAVAGVTSLTSTPQTLNLGALNDWYKSGINILKGNFAHKFNDNVSLNVSYMKQSWNENLSEHRTNNHYAIDTNGNPVPTLAGITVWQRQQVYNVDNVNAYFNIEKKTGALTNKLIIGYDLSSWQKLLNSTNQIGGYYMKDGSVSNSFVPANLANYQTMTVNGVVMPRTVVPVYDLTQQTNTIQNIGNPPVNLLNTPDELTTTNALYLQEQAFWKKFILLFSLRNEWWMDVANYKSAHEVRVNQSVLLPRIGLTYSVSKSINVYGTYLMGYQLQSNSDNLSNFAGAGSTFAPMKSDLKEIGMKANLFNGKLMLNSAIYEINETNLLLNAQSAANPDSLVLGGALKSQGFEIDLAGFILPNWQIAASFSYINATYVKADDPTLVGLRLENTPVNSANLWTRYNFSHRTALKNMGIGLGVQYMSEEYPWFSRQFLIPAHTLVDMAIYYTPPKSRMQLGVKVNNLTNEVYWFGAFSYVRLFPGTPRNYLFTATYKF